MNFSVVYNGYTIGGSSIYAKPLGELSWSEDRTSIGIGIDFILGGDPDYVGTRSAAYQVAEAAMLLLLRVPEKAFTVATGATTIVAGDPAAKTAFLVETVIRQVPDNDIDSPEQLRWRLEIRARVPCRISGDSGRIEGGWRLSYTGSRLKQLVVTATYTASTAPATAYAVAVANFPTWKSAAVTAVGGTFETIGEGPIIAEHKDGLCDISITLREINYTTAGAGVRNETIVFTRRRRRKETPTRIEVSISYAAEVNAGTTAETALDALWVTIRGTLVTKAVALYSANAGYIESAPRAQSSSENTIAGTVDLILVASGYTFRRLGAVAVSHDASRLASVSISGLYTTDGSATARSKYDADIATFCTAALTALSLQSDSELILEGPLVQDDDSEELAFTRLYRQTRYTSAAAGVRNEAFGFSRDITTMHGLPGEVPPVRCGVTYSAEFDATTTAQTAILAAWTGTILPFLIAKAQALYGGQALVEGGTSPNIDPRSNSIRASLRLLMVGAGSNIVSYAKAATFRQLVDRVWRDRYDGKADSYHYWTRRAPIFAIMVVEREELGSLDNTPDADVPDVPPVAYGGAGDGRWIVDGERAVEMAGPFEHGRGGGGITQTSMRKTTISRFRWVNANSAKVGASTDGGVLVPGTGAFAHGEGLS